MVRLVIAVLRIILIFVLIYYFIKLLAKWLSSGTRSASVGGKKRGASGRGDYDELTDQTIEDADFEEITEDDKS